MPPIRVVALLVVGALAADPPSALRVIRVTPLSEASPAAVITVTFDRPVIGSLDHTIDPATVLTVVPAIEGAIEWRDPVTLRLRPARPLEPGASYRLTVSPEVVALDGSRLAEPYRFGFRVTGPELLTGLPIGPGSEPRFLPAEPALDLVFSSPVDSAALSRLVYLELGQACRGRTVRLAMTRQRAIPDSAPWPIANAGGWDRDRSLDPLRRLVTVRPTEPLPPGCAGNLVSPAHLDPATPGEFRRWPFATHGGFRLASATCGGDSRSSCPTGPITLVFSTPVKGGDLARHLSILPKVPFSVSDTADARDRWTIWTDLAPRTGYLIELSPGLTDGFGQALEGNPRATVVTTSWAPAITYLTGRLTVERAGARTLPVTYVNVDTIEVLTVPVPDSLEPKLLARGWYGWGEDWIPLAKKATSRKFAVGAPRDRHGIFGVPFTPPDARRPNAPTLFLVKVTSRALPRPARETGEPGTDDRQPIALVQITDLGVHAKIGPEEGVVWVTGASDGKPRPGASVRIEDDKGRLLARGTTDRSGLVRFTGLRRRNAPAAEGEGDEPAESFEGLVDVRLGADRAVVGVTEYDPDLSPWRFNVSGGWGVERIPAAAAVFTERGIYRPGDSVFAKAIVRTGLLGALRAPRRSDSIKIVWQDRDGGVLKDSTFAPSAFGTAAPVLRLPADAPLGAYTVLAKLERRGRWQELARATYRVAEYRAPEFLVDVTADTAPRITGDTLEAVIAARYLFGAPMARARVTWSVRQRMIEPWELEIPNTEGFYVGARGWWYEEFQDRPSTIIQESHEDSLDATGHLAIRTPVELRGEARTAARVSIDAVVTDVNRQTVYGTATTVVHPAELYLGAKPAAATYFWPAGAAQTVEVIAVRPTGQRVGGVRVGGALVRREWHQVRRENDGSAETVGEWVADTVDRCAVTVAPAGTACRLTPPNAGSYVVTLSAADSRGRPVVTSFYRWVTGPGFVPWADDSRFKMDVIPDRSRYSVGDTATVLFASPFTGAEAWVTVEREGLIEQRRLVVTEGATTLRLPITEAWSPNAFVSIVVARGRSAEPGPLDDPGRPTIRVGYAEVRVTPERKRLAVTLAADRPEYRPGDRATITATVTDRGRGARSEVTIWAVDEGVLSLTGYRTPDPIDLLYQPRGLGLRLASNLSTLVPQVAAGDKGRNPGGGGGAGFGEILRSRFRATAFFLRSVVTDSNGIGRAEVRLPDNLTTFRLMAVAVTAGDRFGSGQSPLLVTRPLVARAALPRFVRPGDRFTAGVVVNHRTGGTPSVTVAAKATGVRLEGDSSRAGTLEAGRGQEIRFDFGAVPGDSAVFRFDVAGAGDQDALRLGIPIRPAFRSRTTTVAGTVRDSARAVIDVSPGTDLSRSRLSVSLGSSPLTLLQGYAADLQVYPYYCSEQVSSVAAPLIALYRARKTAGREAGDTVRLRREIDQAVATLVRRQRDDGAIGFWSAEDWSSPWLTARAGTVLLEAKAAGLRIQDTVFAALAGYLQRSLERQENMALSVALAESEIRASLAERVAVAEYLSRAGRRNRPLENELLRRAGQLAPEDRMQLAITLARGNDLRSARSLLEPYWAVAKIEGRTATLPDSLRSRFYFPSTVAPLADLLLATLAIEPSHPLLGPLFESVVTRGRATPWWNTRDYAAAVRAVDAWQRRFPPAELPSLRIRSGGWLVLETAGGKATGDSSIALSALLRRKSPGRLALDIESSRPGSIGFYYLSLVEVPATPPVRPEDQGFVVERWFEDYGTGKPITGATEGDLVRVRIRITVPADRAFVVVDDPLPAGLEAIDLSLRTAGGLPGPGAPDSAAIEPGGSAGREAGWAFGTWDAGWWSPFDHRELRDDRVIYAARALWKGTYTATYLARATTPGSFVRPQTHVEEMYNPGVFGRSEGGVFQVRAKTR